MYFLEYHYNTSLGCLQPSSVCRSYTNEDPNAPLEATPFTPVADPKTYTIRIESGHRRLGRKPTHCNGVDSH